MADTPTTVEELPESECWRLLASQRVARFAVATGGGVHLVPVNHVVANGRVYFRTGPGGKVGDVWAHPEAALETDGRESERFWSVVVEGRAETLASDDPEAADAVRPLVSLHPAPKRLVIRLTPERIAGRRFPASSTAALWG